MGELHKGKIEITMPIAIIVSLRNFMKKSIAVCSAEA